MYSILFILYVLCISHHLNFKMPLAFFVLKCRCDTNRQTREIEHDGTHCSLFSVCLGHAANQSFAVGGIIIMVLQDSYCLELPNKDSGSQCIWGRDTLCERMFCEKVKENSYIK